MAVEKFGLPTEVEEVVKKAKYNVRSSKFQLPWPLDAILPSDRATRLYGFIVCAVESSALLLVAAATLVHYSANLAEYKGQGSPAFTLLVTLAQLVVAFVFEAFFLAGLLKEKHSLCQYQPTAQLAAVCVLLINGIFALAVDLGGSDDRLHFAIRNPPVIRLLAWFSLIWIIAQLYLHSITVPVCRLLKAKNSYAKFVQMNFNRYHRKVFFTMAQNAFNEIAVQLGKLPRNKPSNAEVCESTIDSGIGSNGGSLPYSEASAANGVTPQPQPSSPAAAHPVTTVHVIIDETLMAEAAAERAWTPLPVLIESDSDDSRRRFEENMDARGEDTPSIVSLAESGADEEQPQTQDEPGEEEAESEEEESSSEDESESSSSSDDEESDEEEYEEEV